jgi:hypothetical protein
MYRRIVQNGHGQLGRESAELTDLQPSRGVAGECASRGVRVYAVAPRYVENQLTRLLIDSGQLRREPVHAQTRMNLGAATEEIVNVRYISSLEPSYTNGHVVNVDTGFLAGFGEPSASASTADGSMETRS